MLVGLGSAAKRKTAMALATATAMATPAMGFVLTEQSNKLQMDPLARTYQKGHI